jgi:protein phosphatase 1L
LFLWTIKVLHEIVGASKLDVITLAAVMDGHCGNAASNFVQQELPLFLSEGIQMTRNGQSMSDLLLSAWYRTCASYQEQCMLDRECIAEYDPVEGKLMANTGSDIDVAGTTICAVLYDNKSGSISFLNCGDSRGMLCDATGKVLLRTHDHKPENELERFRTGAKQGLKNYQHPVCRMNKWRVIVGKYNFAVSRSLEGEVASSFGIVSEADIIEYPLPPPVGSSVIVATDGLWQVMDCAEVARMVARERRERMRSKLSQRESAANLAKTICTSAIRKGSDDNVSCIVWFF